MSEYYFKSKNSKFNTYRSPYLGNSQSQSKERFQKRQKLSLSQKSLKPLVFRHYNHEPKLSETFSQSKHSDSKHYSMQNTDQSAQQKYQQYRQKYYTKKVD